LQRIYFKKKLKIPRLSEAKGEPKRDSLLRGFLFSGCAHRRHECEDDEIAELSLSLDGRMGDGYSALGISFRALYEF
jgi:hypothetical protein